MGSFVEKTLDVVESEVPAQCFEQLTDLMEQIAFNESVCDWIFSLVS